MRTKRYICQDSIHSTKHLGFNLEYSLLGESQGTYPYAVIKTMLAIKWVFHTLSFVQQRSKFILFEVIEMRKPCPDDSRIKHKRYTLVELLEGVCEILQTRIIMR